MQTISVLTTQNVSIQYPVASVGDRILAYLLDRLILIVYMVVVIAAIVNMGIENVVWLWIVLVAFPIFFYHLLFEIFMNGQSPGKRVMRIQVVRLEGTQPTVGDYLLRWIFSFIDFYILSGALAVIIIAINGKGQRLGDIVAGTSVVKLTAQKEISADQVFITPDNAYVPVFPQAIQLSPGDIELVQRALEAHENFANMQPVLMATQKIKSLLGIESDMPPVQFLYTIVNDFNHQASQ